MNINCLNAVPPERSLSQIVKDKKETVSEDDDEQLE